MDFKVKIATVFGNYLPDTVSGKHSIILFNKFLA
jgi:hypothetical protein